MNDLADFCRRYPRRTMRLPGGETFSYRYHRHPGARATVVLLPGGIGLSDLFYLHFERFAEDCSVITFDYQERFATNAELARAIACRYDAGGFRAMWRARAADPFRGRPHLQSGEQGCAGASDAGADRRHRSCRRSSCADGAHDEYVGAVRGFIESREGGANR